MAKNNEKKKNRKDENKEKKHFQIIYKYFDIKQRTKSCKITMALPA